LIHRFFPAWERGNSPNRAGRVKKTLILIVYELCNPTEFRVGRLLLLILPTLTLKAALEGGFFCPRAARASRLTLLNGK
jgi:hypothetical protein